MDPLSTRDYVKAVVYCVLGLAILLFPLTIAGAVLVMTTAALVMITLVIAALSLPAHFYLGLALGSALGALTAIYLPWPRIKAMNRALRGRYRMDGFPAK